MNVYVVHGPPLSGKSTYVQEHKGPNDLVFDFDLIMSALSGLPVHQHNENLIGYVLDIRDLIINRLRHEDKLDAAWIIVTTIRPRLRQALSGIDVKYIELSVDEATARRRLRNDPDGRDVGVWDQVIDKHFRAAEVRKLYKSAAWLRVREQLTDDENMFVWLRYDKEKPHEEIWEAMHMSRAQYFRFRKDVIGKIARYVGLV